MGWNPADIFDPVRLAVVPAVLHGAGVAFDRHDFSHAPRQRQGKISRAAVKLEHPVVIIELSPLEEFIREPAVGLAIYLHENFGIEFHSQAVFAFEPHFSPAPRPPEATAEKHQPLNRRVGFQEAFAGCVVFERKAAVELSHQHDLFTVVARHNLNMPDGGSQSARPVPRASDGAIRHGSSDDAGVDLDQLVRRGAVKTELFIRARLQADAPAVAVFLRRGEDRQQLESTELADAPERVLDALCLGVELRFVADHLPRAAAAFADVRAWRLDSLA